MIAWGYDADLVAFTADGVDFDAVGTLAQYKLSGFGYVFSNHGGKYRVSPKEAWCWVPYKELYQEVRARDPSQNRAEIMRATPQLWKDGQGASRPHGSNCIDIEV